MCTSCTTSHLRHLHIYCLGLSSHSNIVSSTSNELVWVGTEHIALIEHHDEEHLEALDCVLHIVVVESARAIAAGQPQENCACELRCIPAAVHVQLDEGARDSERIDAVQVTAQWSILAPAHVASPLILVICNRLHQASTGILLTT